MDKAYNPRLLGHHCTTININIQGCPLVKDELQNGNRTPLHRPFPLPKNRFNGVRRETASKQIPRYNRNKTEDLNKAPLIMGFIYSILHKMV